MKSTFPVYRDAVTKLKLLLQGSDEALAFTDGEEYYCSPKTKTVNSFKKRLNDKKFRSEEKIFGSSLTDQRHRSWHNLIQAPEEEEESILLAPNIADYESLVHLIKNQESYIAQIKKETKFCRSRLETTFNCIKDIVENRDCSDTPLQINTNDDDEENSFLKETIEELKKELNAVLRRESEAVEQVAVSVEIAEQVRLEKSEIEYEKVQLSMQVERQQTKIRQLIEEQVLKQEEERNSADKRYQAQLQAIREEYEASNSTLEKLSAEIESRIRKENELKKTLVERDQLIDDINKTNEKRISELESEILAEETKRQKMEQGFNLSKLDFESSKHEFKSDKSRSDSEILSLKARLSRTEELLQSSRSLNIEESEKVATLERELALTRLHLEKISTKTESEDSLLQSYIKECEKEKQNSRIISDRLEAMIKRQSRIINDLKNQSEELSDKLENVSRELYSKNKLIELQTEKNKEIEFLYKETKYGLSESKTKINDLETELRLKTKEAKEAIKDKEDIYSKEKLLKEEIALLNLKKDSIKKQSSYNKSSKSLALASSALTIKKRTSPIK